MNERLSEVSSRRIRSDLLRSEMKGHATAAGLLRICDDYRTLVDPGAVWIVDATKLATFAYDTVEVAKREFMALARERGLTTMVGIMPSGLPRMGAMAVASALRAVGSSLTLNVVDDDAAANAFLAKR
jgi:hypothetical protein